MLEAELIRIHPTLYHLAEPDAWPSIQRLGLLSTEALLDVFEVVGQRREELLTRRRSEKVVLEHPTVGRAVLRDNKPLTETKLAASLTGGASVEDFLRAINARTFFWPTRERLETLLAARAYRSESHLVIEVSTRKLLRRRAAEITLSPINSGATEPFAAPRGLNTFATLDSFDFDYWSRKRGGERKAIAEVSVLYAVPDLVDFVEAVYVRRADGTTSPA